MFKSETRALKCKPFFDRLWYEIKLKLVNLVQGVFFSTTIFKGRLLWPVWY